MRVLYTILFFADTLLLGLLTYIFLQKIDVGDKIWVLAMIFLGIATSIFLLILLLKQYIKQPPGKDRRQ